MADDTTLGNGNKPVNQFTRDTMAQADHDKLIEYGVILKTIVEGQTRLEVQIKDLLTGQAQALASWEATSKAIHDAQDSRIRKMEDLASEWIPRSTGFIQDVEKLKKDVQILKDNDNKFLGGWKTLVFIGGVVAGLAGLIISIIDISTHLPYH